MSFGRYFPPDADAVLAMSPQELAVPLLRVLRDRVSRERTRPIEPNDPIKLPDGMYGAQRQKVLLILAEAFSYLLREGLVIPQPPELHNYADKEGVRYTLSQAGRAMDLPGGLEQHQHASLLPKALLLPALHVTVLPLFQRRDFETEVFVAMKQVEVAVREAAGLPENLVGTGLMRKAFAADQRMGSGFAADAERQALSDLFAGAMGYFRNTTGHRTVDFTPAEAARVILFASELLSLVQERVRATQ